MKFAKEIIDVLGWKILLGIGLYFLMCIGIVIFLECYCRRKKK